MKVCILQVQGHRPVRGSDRLTNKAGGLHAEVWDLEKFVEATEVDDRSPASRLQGSFGFFRTKKILL